MNRLGRLAQLIGVNTIPVAGVFLGNWSDATAIAFYWCAIRKWRPLESLLA